MKRNLVNKLRIQVDFKAPIQFRLPAANYIFKVNNRDARTRLEIYSKLTKKTLERRPGVFIVSF